MNSSVRGLAVAVMLAVSCSACGSSGPERSRFAVVERVEYWLVTDCVSTEEVFCGEFIEFYPDGGGGHLAGGDVVYTASWSVEDGIVVVDSAASGELRFELVGNDLHEVATDRVFARGN